MQKSLSFCKIDVFRKLDTPAQDLWWLSPPCEAGDDGAESGPLFIFRARVLAVAMAGQAFWLGLAGFHKV